MDYESIKNKKIKEAEELYKSIGLNSDMINLQFDQEYFPYTPIIQRQNQIKEKAEFHWTRLSNNSNIGCIVE